MRVNPLYLFVYLHVFMLKLKTLFFYHCATMHEQDSPRDTGVEICWSETTGLQTWTAGGTCKINTDEHLLLFGRCVPQSEAQTAVKQHSETFTASYSSLDFLNKPGELLAKH